MAEKLTDAKLRSLVDAEFDAAMGAEGGEIAHERAKALDYYFSKPLGNEQEGQSSVVSSDVSDVVDSIMPSLLRIFTTAENLVAFDPVGPEDIEAAEQESDYVNHVFFKSNPSFTILYGWFFDALVQKNGIVKAWWDESEVVNQETYTGLNELELLQIVEADEGEEVKIIESDERSETTISQDGSGIAEETVFDVTIERINRRGRVKIENIPPEEYRISADSRSLDAGDARFVGHEREVTRSDLLAMGFDRKIVEELPAENNVANTTEELRRRDRTDDQDNAPHDRSQDRILLREGYIRVDQDGDGRAELRQVFTANGKLLSNEIVDRQPFHLLTPQPLPHKHFGRSIADRVLDVQDVNTTLLRQTLDNLYHSNNPSHAVWEQGLGEHTMDDLLTTQAGGVKRFARPVAESWAPISVPFTAGNSFSMIEYFEKVKRDRTGISSDGNGLNPEALKNVQTTVLAQAADLSRMKIETIARIFAETGIKSLFLHIHEIVSKYQNKLEVVRLRNRWVQVDPQRWRRRHDMSVNIGLGIGTREQNLLHLEAIWQKQMQGAALGIVTPQNMFATGVEIVKNANLKQGELFFTNPGDAGIPQAQDEAQQLAQLQAQLQARQQELDAAKQSLNEQKAQLEHVREMTRMQIDQQKAVGQQSLQREKIGNDLFVAMEDIRNKLTEMELKFAANVPGSRV